MPCSSLWTLLEAEVSQTVIIFASCALAAVHQGATYLDPAPAVCHVNRARRLPNQSLGASSGGRVGIFDERGFGLGPWTPSP